MSAEDAVMCSRTESIQMLSDEQKRIVLRLRDDDAVTLHCRLQAKQEDNQH